MKQAGQKVQPPKGYLKEYAKKKLKHLGKEIKRGKVSYLFIAPFCILFTLFYLVPVIISIGLSFTYYNVLETPNFIGWQNYINLF